MQFVVSLALTLIAGEVVDSLARPRRRILGGGVLASGWRLSLIAVVWLLAVGCTGRAGLAAAATVVAVAVLMVISNLKWRHLHEPLVFSDFALLEHCVRHPRLFYLSARGTVALLAGIGAVVCWIWIWVAIEPRGVGGPLQLAAALGAMAAIAAGLTNRQFEKLARRIAPVPDLETHLAGPGLIATLAAYLIRFRHAEPVAAAAPPSRAQLSSFDAVVVVQAESFVDLRRHGWSDVQLPALDGLRARAVASGVLEVPCQGAYTLRPESAVITGLGFDEQDFDRFHPYLRPHRWSGRALPRRLAESGWDTVFIHPHDSRFFRRDRAMPVLGFQAFVGEPSFESAERYGPYVSDAAVARVLLAAVTGRPAEGPPLFAYAVTMEAHDPYGAGRLAGDDDPTRQYIRHIENTDHMLAALRDGIEAAGRRVLLVFFGDHVPFLPLFADRQRDTRTDYVVVELGPHTAPAGNQIAVSKPEHLHDLMCRAIGWDEAGSCQPGRARLTRE